MEIGEIAAAVGEEGWKWKKNNLVCSLSVETPANFRILIGTDSLVMSPILSPEGVKINHPAKIPLLLAREGIRE